MAVNESIPYWDTGDTLTARAATALSGKRIVSIVGGVVDGHPLIGYAEGGSKHYGVTGYDVASGGDVTIHHARSIVAPVTAGENLAAGDLCTSDAQGRAVKLATVAGATTVGIALAAAVAGADVIFDRSVR